MNDVLDLSKLESCKLYHFDAVDLAQPVEQTLRTYQLTAKDKGIELVQEIEPDLPAVLGNYDLLLQVLSNLVGNALKFTQSQGTIGIRAYRLHEDSEGHFQSVRFLTSPATSPPPQMNAPLGRVRVEIADTGIGIDAEDQEAIFDRFFRVENRVHTLEGTGLGLSIVRNIIEKHRSRVHLISEVGKGTTFWFDLAIYQGPVLELSSALKPTPPRSAAIEVSEPVPLT